jgi:lipoprotein-anchoring transpeptidase ErfK/SrfK
MSKRETIGFVQGGIIGMVVVGLLAVLATWLIGRPAQAAPPVPASPVPTVYVPVITPTPSGRKSLPTATPLAPTPASPTAAPAMVAAGAEGVNVRSGPSTNFARIGYLDPGAEARVVGHYGDWWQIAYDGATGWVAGWVVAARNTGDVPEVVPPSTPVPAAPEVILPPAAPWEITEVRWIDVDLSEQTLTAYENGVVVRTTLVSTGLPGTPTPTGQFRIWIKFRTDDMEGPGYYIEDVPYVMYFYKGFGLHGVTWHGNFGHPMSHGCVNLPTEEAEWLFGWADVGTLVNIHD